MIDFFFDDFIEQIKEFQCKQVEEREKILAEAITRIFNRRVMENDR